MAVSRAMGAAECGRERRGIIARRRHGDFIALPPISAVDEAHEPRVGKCRRRCRDQRLKCACQLDIVEIS